CAAHLGAILKKKPLSRIWHRFHAPNSSITAEQALQIVQFLAWPRGFAEPAAQLLQHPPRAFGRGSCHRIKARGRIVQSIVEARGAPKGVGTLPRAKLAARALALLLSLPR